MTLLVSLCAGVLFASEPLAQYLYKDAEPLLPFDISYEELVDLDSGEKALGLLERVYAVLNDGEKADPYVIEALTLLAEECIRYGGGRQDEGLGAEIAELSQRYDVVLIRELRTSIVIASEDSELYELSAADRTGLNAYGAGYLYVSTPFAGLRLDLSDDQALVSLRRLDSGTSSAQGRAVAQASSVTAEKHQSLWQFALALALRIWSIWLCMLFVLIALFIPSLRRQRATKPVVAVLCIVFIGINLLSDTELMRRGNAPVADSVHTIDAEHSSMDAEGIELVFGDRTGAQSTRDMVVILSIPLVDERDRDLTLTDASGKPIPSKYNPLTQMMDARIKQSGIYSLSLSAVYFGDILDKSAEMQHAIRILTSRGLMDGGDERRFLPDREITRAGFLSAVLQMMDLLDPQAQSTFPDVIRSDWYYPIAASAEQEGLVAGYDDGLFHGNTPIPKIQMVSVAANALERMMGYHVPDDDEVRHILTRYYSDAEIADWAEHSVALATRAGVVPERADGLFDGDSVMTRGDAAVMLYRLFNRLW